MTLVRTGTGEIIICAWAECDRSGHDENHVDRHEGQKTLRYIFCTEMHRDLYVNSHKSYGNLGNGPRRSPLGLIIP